jgi:hypothetical protein
LPKKVNPAQERVQGIEGGGSGAPVTILPFWDDFSTSQNLPDEAKWFNSADVRIASNVGVNPPTINVAVFDGVDANGAAYNPGSLLNGRADCLTSAIIDLSMIEATNQTDSVYMSFFWQLKGNGELADPEDSLVLQFLNEDMEWETVWRRAGGTELLDEDFQQELLQLTPEYFHDSFQFRFQAYARLSGPFDTWLLDYIYINDSRHDDDVAYLDRALTTPGNFLTTPYTAIPTEQFFQNPDGYLQTLSVGFYNLNSFFQPVLFTSVVTDLVTGNEIEILSNEQVATPIPGAFARRTFTSPALNSANLDQNADSLWLESTVYLRTGDVFFIEDISNTNDTTFNEQIDYRLNDTVRNVTIIDDYLAYDDHEADFAAGINQRGGQLAYRYTLETRALLTHIDINFPFTNQAGEPIEIKVWQNIGEEDSVMYQDPFSVLRSDEISQLRSYALDTPIFVEGTIYIGFQQATNEFLAVGLDKNTDSGDQIFFNVDGSWQMNELVQGSLLMRPRFDKEIAENFVPPNNPGTIDPGIFPNPSEGLLTVEGHFDQILLFDGYGRSANFTASEERESTVIDLTKNESGIYLIRLTRDGRSSTKRIILKN